MSKKNEATKEYAQMSVEQLEAIAAKMHQEVAAEDAIVKKASERRADINKELRAITSRLVTKKLSGEK